MNTYFLTNRFGELVVYNLKRLTIDILDKLGPIQQIGELRVIVDKNVNDIGHMKTDIESIKRIIETLDPETITVISQQEIDEIMAGNGTYTGNTETSTEPSIETNIESNT